MNLRLDFQFSLRSLLLLMIPVAMTAGLMRVAIRDGNGGAAALAIQIGMLTVLAALSVATQGWRQRGMTKIGVFMVLVMLALMYALAYWVVDWMVFRRT